MKDQRTLENQILGYRKSHDANKKVLYALLRGMSPPERLSYIDNELLELSKSGATAFFELVLVQLKKDASAAMLSTKDGFELNRLVGERLGVERVIETLLEHPEVVIARRFDEETEEDESESSDWEEDPAYA